MVSFSSAFKSHAKRRTHFDGLLARGGQNIRLAVETGRLRGRLHVVAVAPLALLELRTEALLPSSVEIGESAEALVIVLEALVSHDDVDAALLGLHQLRGNHGMELHREGGETNPP